MNYKLKIRISILLCFALVAFSIYPISVGAASIGESVPTDVSYWGFDENTTSSILNQGYNNILCLWDFENHEYLLVKCPDHMYYVPGGVGFIDGDYTGLFKESDYQNYIRDQIVYSWAVNKAYFDLTAMQYFTVYRVSSDGTLNATEQAEFKGIVNGTAWNGSKTKYNALRWLYDHDLNTYNNCNYALCWSTDSIDYAYTGTGNVSMDLWNWATAVFFSDFSSTAIYFTGGSTLNAHESDIPVYVFYPGGFNFTSPVAATPTPTPNPSLTGVIMYGDYIPFQLGNIPSYGTDIYANGFESSGEVINIANALPDHLPTYASIFAGVDYDNYNRPFFGIYITDSNTFDNPLTGFTFDHFVYGPYTSVDGSVSKYVHYFIRSSAYNWHVFGKPNLDNVNIPEFYWNDNSLNEVSSSYYPYLAGYGYCDFYGFNGQTNPATPTPSPTSSPTPTPYIPVYVSPTPTLAPSPGVTITPTSGPTETSVKELRGWKGALRQIFQSVFIGNTDAIEGYFKDAVSGYNIVQNPFKQIVDSIYVEGSDQENFNPFENQQIDFIFDVHDQNGNVLGGEHTTNWRLTILPKTFWEWLKSYSNYFEIVFYLVDASFLGATMKRWLTKQNDEGSETKEGGDG